MASAIITSAILFITSNFYEIGPSKLIYLPIFEAILFFSVMIERMILKDSPLATLRRLIAISSFSCTIWLLILLIGLLLSIPFSIYAQIGSLSILGFFGVTAFRLLVYESVFRGSVLKKAFTAFFQPILLAPMLLIIPSTIEVLMIYSLPTLGGIVILGSVMFYLILIDRIGVKTIGLGSLELLRAFLSAWAANRPEFIENIMKRMGSQKIVRANAIVFKTGRTRPTLVIPEVHPGPFNPVGSSNLPSHLQEWFLKNGFSPFILHGVSGHELNLPSRSEVDKFVSSFERPKTMALGDTCTIPIVAKAGKATASCIVFGNVAIVILTLSPFGMEDLPLDLKQEVEIFALKVGYTHTIVVDAHNSQGETISREDFDALIRAAKDALVNLKGVDQYSFMVGFAHSSELDLRLGDDIGPAGLGAMVFDINGKRFSLLISDSNSAKRGLREELLEGFKGSKAPILELCTSDTHFTAGKTLNSKGYITLGERTNSKELSEATNLLIEKATERTTRAKFQVIHTESSTKVIGNELIDRFAMALERSLSLVKKGGLFIIALSLLITILVAI
ncbi:MAG: DUF2070 family protein [Nitrososphaerales archaeon]